MVISLQALSLELLSTQAVVSILDAAANNNHTCTTEGKIARRKRVCKVDACHVLIEKRQ